MGFGFGGAALLAAVYLVGAAAITALHLVRQRRRSIEVGFAALWLRAARQKQRSSRRLRPLLSWLLQLAILALLVAAAGDPRLRRGSHGARTVAVIVDVSGSMQVRDEAGGRSRLERARREALRVLDGIGPDDRAVVLVAGARAVARGGLTADADALRAQAQVDGEQGASDVAGAVRLAGTLLAEGGAGTTREVVLISDGEGVQARLDGMPPGLLGDAELRFLPVGTSQGRVAIASLSARRYPAHPADYEALVVLRSTLDRASRARLELRQEGALVDTLAIDLPPRSTVERRLPDLAGSGPRLEARLLLDGTDTGAPPASADRMEPGSRAFAVLPSRRPLRVLVCAAAANLFLDGALLVDEGVSVDRAAPGDCRAHLGEGYGAVVLDGFVPADPPPLPSLLLNPTPGAESGAFVRVAGDVAAPIVTQQASRHPVMRFVDLLDTNFARAQLLQGGPGDVALASTAGGAIALARERSPRRITLGFDLRRTDLPLRPGFPILLANALRWLAGSDVEYVPPLLAGVPARIEAGGDEAVLAADDGGARERVPVRNGQAWVTGRTPGFLTLERSGIPPLVVAVNPDPAEVAGDRPASLSLGGHPLRPPDPARSPARRSHPWRVLALAALVLLVIEWWAAHRRVIG